jgi:cellulose synthase/poly-beta-1,6-N-acetylglucosamine synthase-like glycosyltransferase
MLNLSIGIMAYNEEANIGRLLESLLRQKFVHSCLKEIFVVASGCTDRTEEIVQDFMKQDKRIKLLIQPQREGKASAINLFLSKASGDIFIMESGDTVPKEGTLDKLVTPFRDPNIGMTGAHPIPVNSKDSFIGFTVNLMWSLHHRIALMTPKLGELVAFRSLVREIPKDTAVDEASIEAIIRDAGYELYYVPDAFVKNKGPENIRDFIKQRRRIAAGHKYLLREQKHEVSTSDPKNILRLLIQEHSWNLKDTVWTIGAICLEMIGRALGYYDFYVRKKNPYVWDIASSTKRLDSQDKL